MGEGNNKDTSTQLSFSHKTSNDFINSGTFFDQRLVRAYFTSSLSTTMLNFKISDTSKDNFTLNSGLITNWKNNDPYGIEFDKKAKDAPERERWLTTLSGEKNFNIGNEKKLSFSVTGAYIHPDKPNLEVTYLAPEIKIKSKDFSYGVGGAANKNTDDEQLYLTGSYKNTKLNIGAATSQYNQVDPALRLMVSYDYKLNDKNRFQFFTVLETNNADRDGSQRMGITYNLKDDKHPERMSLRTNFILNSTTAYNIENLNLNVDVPFKLSARDKHSLSGVISVFSGLSGEPRSEKNPEPNLNQVYGIGLKLNLFDSKNQTQKPRIS